jgi:hypothetical protein
VCGKGTFTPKVVAFTNELFDEAARAEVGWGRMLGRPQIPMSAVWI